MVLERFFQQLYVSTLHQSMAELLVFLILAYNMLCYVMLINNNELIVRAICSTENFTFQVFLQVNVPSEFQSCLTYPVLYVYVGTPLQ